MSRIWHVLHVNHGTAAPDGFSFCDESLDHHRAHSSMASDAAHEDGPEIPAATIELIDCDRWAT